VYVAFDILYRMLSLALGYKVQYVRNFTDIDDKIIARAAENGDQPLELASRFIDEFQKVRVCCVWVGVGARACVCACVPHKIVWVGSHDQIAC